MKKILLVFGTRPEAIKMAPLALELKKHTGEFETKICVTAQHREMLDQVLDIFGIKPEIDLNIMQDEQDLTDVTINVLKRVRNVIISEKPDIVLVHGDTTTSMASALAAFYQQVPVGHVESGLRTYDIYSPWPEEINRQLTDRIASWHFAPTEKSRQNLLSEGVSSEKILVTGNTVIDAMHAALKKMKENHSMIERIENDLTRAGLPLEYIRMWNGNNSERKMVLITGHRRENFGEGFISICKAIRNLAIANPENDFVYPMHLNKNVRKPISEVFGNNPTEKVQNVFFIEPLQYLHFLHLMDKCAIVLTDSGGIQEEAPGLGKPVLVMRNTTERPEAVEAGTVKLVGTDQSVIFNELNSLLHDAEAYRKMAVAQNPYGDGKASEKIVQKLKSILE